MTINTLPVEVLSRALAALGNDFAMRYLERMLDIPGVAIYGFVNSPDLGDEYAEKLRRIMRRELPCLYVIRVCRRWYQIAMSTPELWTCLPIFDRETTTKFIARADDSPVEWPLVVSQMRASMLAEPDRQRALMPALMSKTRALLWLHNIDIQETRDEVGHEGS